MPLFLIARIAGQGVVFDADQVDAVVDIGEVVDVPRVEPSIRGLAALRSRVVTVVDTPGAYPGKGAEERGQSEAIARSTEKCLQIEVPLVSVIIGEGGSGGAVAFATANRVAMLEHSIYSVISPAGCASILWKDSEKMREAAEALRLTAQELKELGVCDRIVAEPLGGAHRDASAAIDAVGREIGKMLDELKGMDGKAIRADRRKKYLDLGSKGLAA